MLCQRLIADILHPASQILMVVFTLLVINRTFFFFRIFSGLAFLVSMIKQVVMDLRPFLFIFFFLLMMFGLCLGNIDWGSYEFSDDPVTRNIQYTSTGPDKEYLMMHKLLARVIACLRLSVNDYNFDATTYMNPFDNGFYWLLYLIVAIISAIIFLNFIIAEVGASYSNVKDTLHVTLLQQKGQLINEA